MDRTSPNIVYLLTSLLLLYKMVEGILCLSPCRQLRGVLSLGGPPGAGGVGGPAPATLPRPPAQHRPRQGAEVAESELHLRVTGPASSSCHGVSWHVTACHGMSRQLTRCACRHVNWTTATGRLSDRRGRHRPGQHLACRHSPNIQYLKYFCARANTLMITRRLLTTLLFGEIITGGTRLEY